MNGKIGFVSIGHEDYLNGLVSSQTKAAIEVIEALGYTVETVDYMVVDHRSARKAGAQLCAAAPDGVVLFLASWLECPSFMSVFREIEHLPVCVQSFPMSLVDGRLESTGAYVSYTMIKGVLDRIGRAFTGILAPVDSPQACSQMDAFCAAAAAASRLKRSRIGLVGYTSMSIYTGTFDHVLLRTKIGPEVEQLDSYSLINLAEGFGEEDRRRVVEEYRRMADIHSEVTGEYLLKSAGLYLAMEQLVRERDFIAVNLKCQYELSKDYKMVPCVPLALLAEKNVVSSCEGDMLNTVSMLMLHYLSGDVVTYGDSINHVDNVLKLSSCGFLPFSMGVRGERQIRNFMPHPGFTGIECSFVMRPERVTVMRLIEDQGSYHILYFTGEGQPTELRQGYMPALDVRLDGDITELVRRYSGQHYAICYGDMSERIETLADMLHIQAIRI